MFTLLTWPVTVWLGRALRVTVADWPFCTLTASTSAKPATTCNVDMSSRVMNAEEALDEPVAELALLEEDDVPPPATVWPTAPLTAATVPAMGAVRMVLDSFFWAVTRFAWAEVTCDSAEATLEGVAAALALLDATVALRLS